MNKLKNNESGFSAVEVILVLVIVVLLGVVGWFVYKNQNKTTPSTTTTQTSTSTNQSEQSKFTNYTNSEFGVSLRYPKEWGTALLANGNFLEFQTGQYKHLTFSKTSNVSINFVTSAYSSPLDACGYGDVVQNAQHAFNSKQASVIGWRGTNIKQYMTGQGFNGPTVYLVSSKAGDTGVGWTRISSKDKVLIYKDIDSGDTRIKATSNGDGCGLITQAQANEANSFLSFYHYAVNYTNSKVKGVNGQFDARKADNPIVRGQLVDVLNGIK